VKSKVKSRRAKVEGGKRRRKKDAEWASTFLLFLDSASRKKFACPACKASAGHPCRERGEQPKHQHFTRRMKFVLWAIREAEREEG
jgi:hypothetical protein